MADGTGVTEGKPVAEVDTPSSCPWLAFDPSWYRATHLRRPIAGEPETAFEHYTLVGAAAGFSPNPFFSERFYLDSNPGVRRAVLRGEIPSGFAHYCAFGHRSRDPHWLFSETYYRTLRDDLTDEQLAQYGLRNGYHHFLIAGQYEEASGSPFFDSALARRATGVDSTPFTALLSGRFDPEPELSVYFDAPWYLAMYPVAGDLIASGEYGSALHHFLANPRPSIFNPSPDFDEEFYRTTNPDVVGLIEAGRHRSAFHHFLAVGRFEGRRPSLWFDPAFYAGQPSVAADLRTGRAATAFDHWLRIGRKAGLEATPPAHLVPVAERDAKALFARMARLMSRQKVSFDLPGGPLGDTAPDVSVVIAAYNQFDLTMQTLLSLSGSTGVRFEVILVDNASRDETRRIEAHVSGLRLVRNAANDGFLPAANQGLALARGRHVLLLNNDVTLAPDALAQALRRLDGDLGIGAVGGMVVRAHGLLQEAGSMVFRDGSCLGYGRDGDPCAPEYNFVRDVDYCSGVFLMVPRAVMQSLGGFDGAYAPAYYEETDLCARIWSKGLRVVYDPAVRVVHLEYGSSRNPCAPRAQMQRNQAVFARRQRDWLETKCLPDRALVLHARSAIRRPRVLVIEDVIPYRHTGSGFGRTADIVQSLTELDCDVTVLPLNPGIDRPADPRQGFAETVEVLWDRDITCAAAFLAERETFYDVVWVCRAHNLGRLAGVLNGSWGPLRHAHVVLDTEALGANRDAVRADLEGTPFNIEQALLRELRDSHLVRTVCAVNEAEAAQLRAAGLRQVHVLGHAMSPSPTPRPFETRKDILAIGSLHGPATPNFDGLRWFIAEVWPIVSHALPEARLRIAGFVADGLDVASLLAGPMIETLGFVETTRGLYDETRVFIAPTRFAAGIPFKVHEAASHGLPVVATRLLAGQLGWDDGAVLACDAADPAAFAAAVVELYRSETLWQTTRDRALARIARDCSPTAFKDLVAGIIGLAAPTA